MKRIILVAVSLVLVVAYVIQNNDKSNLTTNTEAYFLAHGIVQGQVNHLRIGGTLFRFPAGVGLNPYTSQTKIRSIDGSPMTLSSKEGLDQGKYEEVATPIVKGKADSVTFHLEPGQSYAPSPSPFGGGVRVTISQHGFYKWDGVNANPDEYLKNVRGRRVIERYTLGLKEYVAPKEQYGTYFESLQVDANSASQNGLFFSCQPGKVGRCFRRYWVEDGKYSVQIVMDVQFFLHHWQEACPAVTRFVDTVVAK